MHILDMKKISKEVKIGFTVAVALFILGWGVNFLKGKDIFVPGYKVYGIYTRIDGLTEASPIYYKGYKVGSVRKIELMDKGRGDLLVTMSIDVDIEFPKNSTAQIYSLDLMGSKGIRFLYGDSNRMLESGDTLNTSVTGDLADQVSQEVLPLKDKVENLIVRLDTVFTNLDVIFDVTNENGLVNNMNAISYHFRNISKSIDENIKEDGNIGKSMANLDSITEVLKLNGEVLSAMMQNLKKVSKQLADSHLDSLSLEMNQTFTSLNGILNSIDEGDGTMGKLLEDEALYNNLNDVSISLDRLLNDVRVQPKRYVNFSAISFGGGKSKGKDDKVLVYTVLLKKSKEPLDLRGKLVLDSCEIKERRYGKFYQYTIGEDDVYDRIFDLKEQIVKLYPDAEVIKCVER